MELKSPSPLGLILKIEDISNNNITTLPKYSFYLFHSLQEVQSQHGLRQNDYNYHQYHQYCSRRIARLRKGLKCTQASRTKYVKKPISISNINDIRYFFLILMNAERSWASAMSLKQQLIQQQQQSNQPTHHQIHLRPMEDTGRIIFHIRNRLSKAFHYSQELVYLCYYCSDNLSQIESKGYMGYFLSLCLFEKEKWKESLSAFQSTLSIFHQLQTISPLSQKSIFSDKIETLQASIRYCQYLCGMDDTKIIMEEKVQDQQSHNILMLNQDVDMSLQTKLPNIMESFHLHVSDSQKIFINIEKLKEKSQEIQKSIGETFEFHPQMIELIQVYSSLLESLTNYQKSLDPSSSHEIFAFISSQYQLYRAYRCYYLSMYYHYKQKYIESYGLTLRCNELLSSISSLTLSSEIELLDNLNQRHMAIVYSLLLLENASPQDIDLNLNRTFNNLSISTPESTPILSRLDDLTLPPFERSYDIIEFPPKLIQQPTPPILYDLSYNFLSYPSLSHHLKKSWWFF